MLPYRKVKDIFLNGNKLHHRNNNSLRFCCHKEREGGGDNDNINGGASLIKIRIKLEKKEVSIRSCMGSMISCVVFVTPFNFLGERIAVKLYLEAGDNGYSILDDRNVEIYAVSRTTPKYVVICPN